VDEAHEVPAAPAGCGPYPPREGNRVTPWIDGVPFYERLAAAFRAARARIWAVVSFIQPGFRLPDGGAWWDLLDECHARGVDVRVLFWRNPRFFSTAHVFLGDPADRAMLARRRAGWAARWDGSGDDPDHCHHQKAFVVDAGAPDARAFLGGMVLSAATLARPGHREGAAKHDAMVELQGPVVADVAHNFVQRWNHARQDDAAPPWPDPARAGPLAWPDALPPACGPVRVQVCRTLAPGVYPGETRAPGAAAYDCSAGEASVFEHWAAAFAAARRTIYLENQHPGEARLLALLDAALARGVRVAMIVPGAPMPAIRRAAAEVAAGGPHRYAGTFARLAALAARPNFTLAALVRSDPSPSGWTHREIYCHAKLCVVDGAWATIGSANFVDLSLARDHTELGASFWGADTCLPLLRRLVAEHTDLPEPETDVAALDALARTARTSRDRLARGGPPVGGCYALDPTTYGRHAPPWP
jgi:phosphatidylserine/phosphatidylglycerophosphate/cardiolipin synthase-like enzyme